jgi:LmbE family N-acetylglucosaminyl deacetylase
LTGEHDAHVFLSPHFDDVVLSCGGLVASLVEHDRDVRVVTVFGEGASPPGTSAFAQHLHAKWAVSDVTAQRTQEDRSAMQALGVRQFETWEFVEAPYRVDQDGRPLYVTYTALAGEPAREDDELLDALGAMLDQYLTTARDAQIYVPLSLGGHVDHRLLYQLGLRLQASGHSVRFYEDWPYAEEYAPRRQPSQWVSQIANIDILVKVRAAQQYASQVHGLGGSVDALAQRLIQYGRTTGGSGQERYWSLLPSVDGTSMDRRSTPTLPLEPRRPRNLSVRPIARMVRAPDVRETLPVGIGLCIVWGAEAPAFRRVVEERGYHCLGLNPEEPSDGSKFRVPTLTGAASMVVVPDLQTMPVGISAIICEARRVLQPGGIIYLRASGLHVAGPFWLPRGMFDGGIRSTLVEHGFEDVRLSITLSGRREQPGRSTDPDNVMNGNSTTHVKRHTPQILYVARQGRDTAACI